MVVTGPATAQLLFLFVPELLEKSFRIIQTTSAYCKQLSICSLNFFHCFAGGMFIKCTKRLLKLKIRLIVDNIVVKLPENIHLCVENSTQELGHGIAFLEDIRDLMGQKVWKNLLKMEVFPCLNLWTHY